MDSFGPGKTTTGLSQNLAGLLCYVLGWISGLIFLLLEKENGFVRFHAMQSLVVFLPLWILAVILGMIPLFGWAAALILVVFEVALWILLMYKAFNGERYKLPWAGDFAEQQLNKQP